MVAVVAAVGGEIEGDRQALLSGGKIAPIEGVGIFRRREAGILPDGPRLRRVHRGVGTAQERRLAGIGVEEIDAGEIGLRYSLTLPGCLRAWSRARRCRRMARRSQRSRAWRNWGPELYLTPRISCAACKVETTSQPMNMKVLTPAACQLASWLPGRPARWTMAPAVVNALAASAACCK